MRSSIAIALLFAAIVPRVRADVADDAAGFGDLPAVNAEGARAPAAADDAAGWGDLSNTDERGGTHAAVTPAREPGPFSLLGSLREDFGFAPERVGRQAWVLGRTTLEAALRFRKGAWTVHLGGHAEVDPAYLVRRNGFDAASRSTYGGFVMPWETYVEARGRDVTLAVGRQIVAWGQSQLVPLLDLPNPRDLRMPGLGLPTDFRIPLTMTRLAFDHGAHRFELLAIHQVDFRRQPPPMALYSPLPGILARGEGVERSGFFEIASSHSFRYEHEPERFSRGSQQVLARYRYVGSGPEIGLHAGAVVDAQGALRLPVVADWAGEPVRFPVEHRRYGFVGTSLLATVRSVVLFADALLQIRRPINVGDLDALPPVVGIARQSWARYVVGLRHNGLANGYVALEYGAGHHIDREHAQEPLLPLLPLLPVAPPTLAGIYQQRFARDRVELELVASVFGPRLRGGGVARAQLAYRPRDDLRVTLAYVLFVPGSAPSPITGFVRNDRIDLGVRWDFAME